MEATQEFMTDRPVPALDNVSRTFWEATKRGELLYQECPACGNRQYYPRAVCTECLSEPEWRVASGTGTIHTFSVVRQNVAPPFRDWLSYAVAVVDLDEGSRVQANVVGVPVDDIRIGQRAEVVFADLNDDAALPFWKVVSAA
jgi:uncharacterized OB-fold protein